MQCLELAFGLRSREQALLELVEQATHMFMTFGTADVAKDIAMVGDEMQALAATSLSALL